MGQEPRQVKTQSMNMVLNRLSPSSLGTNTDVPEDGAGFKLSFDAITDVKAKNAQFIDSLVSKEILRLRLRVCILNSQVKGDRSRFCRRLVKCNCISRSRFTHSGLFTCSRVTCNSSRSLHLSRALLPKSRFTYNLSPFLFNTAPITPSGWWVELKAGKIPLG